MLGQIGQGRPDRAVGGDSAGDDEGRGVADRQGSSGAVDEAIDDGLLEAGGDVGGAVEPARRGALDRALETGEGEVGLGGANQRAGERDGVRVAFAGKLLDRGAARIGQAEELGRLVERLPGGIVDGRGEAAIVADSAHLEQLAMAPGRKQEQVGEGELRIGEARREGVAFEMIDRDQRLAASEGEALAGEQRDHDATDQARAGGGGNRVEIGGNDPGLVHDAANQPGKLLDMGARGDFRDDSAERAVRLVLADHRLREDHAAAGDERGGAVVARGFEAEDQRHDAAFAPAHRLGLVSRVMTRPIILGTRGSPLALAQARQVASRLEVAHEWPAGTVEIRVVKTTGDRVQDRPLAEIGGKALWTKELDAALLAGETNISVHSMKDVESERPPELCIAAMLRRADTRDRLIGAESIAALKQGAVVGTSSPRRAAQLLSVRPDLRIVPIRGNVETRLAKLAAGECDATLLAAAGLDRLHHGDIGTPLDDLLPAPAQGAIGIECRKDDQDMRREIARISHPATFAAVAAERIFTRTLGGTCHSPVAALATIGPDGIHLRAELYSEDGREGIADEARFATSDLEAPAALARAMLERAPPEIARLFAGG